MNKALMFLMLFGFQFNAFAINDPHNLMPAIDAYVSESFESAFDKNLSYDYSSVTCYEGKNCDKFLLKMTTQKVAPDAAEVVMFMLNGEPFGGIHISKGEWASFNNNLLRRTLNTQMSRYRKVTIESFDKTVIDRDINGKRRSIDAYRVVVSMRNNRNMLIYKIYTITNKVDGFARIIAILEKHQTKQMKTINRIMDHIISK